MKRLIVLSMLAAAALAQDQPKPSEATQKLVTLRYADPNQVRALLQRYPATINYPGSGRVVALRGTAKEIEVTEDAIKQLDVQPKNVELTVYFVIGTNQGNPTGNDIPQDVENVVAQLRKAFAFKNYRMLDALTIRTRSGIGAETTGVLDTSNVPRLTQFRIRGANVSEDGSMIRIDRLKAGLRIPTPGKEGTTYLDTGLETDVDVKVGQKVVVGRSSLAGPDTALFLVLSATVI